MADEYDVFLSYSSADKPAVEAIALRLRDESGLRPFLDAWHLVPGDPWMTAIERAIERSASVAVFLGPKGTGPWHEQESQLALITGAQRRGKRVIPVLLPGARKEDVDGFLSLRTWVDLAEGNGFAALVAGITGRAPGPTSAGSKPGARPDAEAAGGGSQAGVQTKVTPGGVELVLVPGGRFLMGSPEDEEGRNDWEGPQHEVELSSFWLARTPVTNAQYREYLKTNPAAREPRSWDDPRYNQGEQPVVGVSWEEAQDYCKWAGLVLPTEAQWEYACRAGTTTRYHSGDREEDLARVGRYRRNSSGRLYPVRRLEPNAFGLHDMHGNVYEWCLDNHGPYREHPRAGNGLRHEPFGVVPRVIRGGYWRGEARHVRAAYRYGYTPDSRYESVGFRPAQAHSGGEPLGASSEQRRAEPSSPASGEDQRKEHARHSSAGGTKRDSTRGARVDVLVITALKEELDALLEVTTGRLEPWVDGEGGDIPYRIATFEGHHGPIRVAAARLTRMGGVATATVATRLAELLTPGCLAMSGVCAGHPEDTDLGDVVIADRVFHHDQGKLKPGAFEGDLWMHLLGDDWLRAAQDLAGPAEGFHGYVAADDAAGQWWFLDQLLDGRDPMRSGALRRHVPDARRAAILETLRGKLGYVSFAGGVFSLTEVGRDAGEEHRAFHGTLVTERPYHIHVGPMGSGNPVVGYGLIWERLAANQGMRKALAVEMEAAAVGQVAHERSLPFVVAKGVMDHADPAKTDRFKAFAARASAEVLLGFLRQVVTAGDNRSIQRGGVADVATRDNAVPTVAEELARTQLEEIQIARSPQLNLTLDRHQTTGSLREGAHLTIRNIGKADVEVESVCLQWRIDAPGGRMNNIDLHGSNTLIRQGGSLDRSFFIQFEDVAKQCRKAQLEEPEIIQEAPITGEFSVRVKSIPYGISKTLSLPYTRPIAEHHMKTRRRNKG